MKPEFEQSRIFAAPEIDGRKLQDLVAQMRAMVPHYTPEWRFSPEDPDAGTALFYLAADMLQENIKRLNQVPLNHFIAFLDLWRVNLQPARPARTHVVFSLNAGVQETVFVPAGSMMTAAASDGGEDIPFETEEALAVSPARLLDVLNVHPSRDRIVLAAEGYDDALEAGNAPVVPLFGVEGDNLQTHAMYLRHDELLWMDRPSRLKLKWHNAEKRYVEEELAAVMGRSDWLEWSYSSANGWVPFDQVTVQGREVILNKSRPGLLEPVEVQGELGRWIRCVVRPTPDGGRSRSPVLDAVPFMDRVTMRAEHDAENDADGIVPHALYLNDMELERGGCYPFGPHFLPQAAFYVACPEALSKRGSQLHISFDAKCVTNTLRTGPDPEIRWKLIMRTADFEPKPNPKLYVRQVIWEYWNGSAWVRLPESGRYEGLFAGLGESPTSYSLTFACPEDLEPTSVNGQEDRWLRVRVLHADPVSAVVVDYMSPWIENLKFSYAYGASAELAVQSAHVCNNDEWSDVTATVRQGGNTFKPFVPVPAPAPSVYFGFDAPLVKGPIRIHFSLGKRRLQAGLPPAIEWQALVRSGVDWHWMPLKTVDGTSGFTESGMLQFVGLPGMARKTIFGRERVWLRAVDRGNAYGAEGALTPEVAAIHRNAVYVIQRRTIVDEFPEQVAGYYQLSAHPVIGQTVWVDETGHFTEHELARLAASEPDRYEVYRDSDDRIQRLWVRWDQVASLLGSGPDDRHYVLDSAQGRIYFGDGTRGKVPPLRGRDKIRVTYQVTEGARGNVEANQITQLSQPLAFIGGVFNPLAAAGGKEGEPLEGALMRGPQRLKHKGRGISASDVEWMVRELEPGIRKVRCLRDRDASMARSPGALTVVVLSPGGVEATDRDSEMRKRLAHALGQTLPNVVMAAGKLSVIPPAFLEISVNATLVVDAPERIMPTELACLERLNQFLDTGTGRLDGQGWEIGEPIHASVFYGLLQSVPGVQRVDKLHLHVVKIEHGIRQEMTEEQMRQVVHGVVTSGVHRLQFIAP
jgi:hypothetical protein